jgi:imidazolonepropionase
MLLFVNASQVVTCSGPARARRGSELADCGIVTASAVAVEGDHVVELGSQDDLKRAHPRANFVDCGGRVLLPGLVDSHTHAIFGKPRFEEQELRAAGADYMEIARTGGGIHSSVRDLRARHEDELYALAVGRLSRLMACGTTTVEVKSGYGLTLEDELKMLRVARRLSQSVPMRIVSTFLGAHEVPLEARATPAGRADYVRSLVSAMIPRVAADGLAQFVDVFCEPGVFTVEESRFAVDSVGCAPSRAATEAACG